MFHPGLCIFGGITSGRQRSTCRSTEQLYRHNVRPIQLLSARLLSSSSTTASSRLPSAVWGTMNLLSQGRLHSVLHVASQTHRVEILHSETTESHQVRSSSSRHLYAADRVRTHTDGREHPYRPGCAVRMSHGFALLTCMLYVLLPIDRPCPVWKPSKLHSARRASWPLGFGAS